MTTTNVIYSQTYQYQGRQFLVWSYLDANEEGSVMLFAFQCDGVTVEGFFNRDNAVAQARKHIDNLSAEHAEPESEPVDTGQQRGQCQQAELELA
jgi:hypothetical protein